MQPFAQNLTLEDVNHSCYNPIGPIFKSKPPLAYDTMIAHTDEAFNEQLQADFFFCNIGDTNYCVPHALEAATGYSETAIETDSTKAVMVNQLEHLLIVRHGAPTLFPATWNTTKNRCIPSSELIQLN